MSFFKKFCVSAEKFLALFGLYILKTFSAVFIALLKGLKFIVRETAEIAGTLIKAVLWIFHFLVSSFIDRLKVSEQLAMNIRKAKKEGKKQYRKAFAEFIGKFIFGEDGLLYTLFNYIMPIVSVVFAVGIIKYGSRLEYGISVKYNGKDIGIISAESDFENAEREVKQRLSNSLGNEDSENIQADFSLKVVSENDKYISSEELADVMLSSVSDVVYTVRAYGIYIDGEFIGAVKDKDKVQEALDDRLLNYHVEGFVKNISYVNDVTYVKGVYLEESLMEEADAISLLTSEKEKTAVYIVQPDDTEVKICQKYGMELDEFEELNPSVKKRMIPGTMLTVKEHESYLPIQYIKEMETLSFLDYETIEVETTSLNVGVRSIIVKGEKGEKKSEVEITYVDGVERSRNVISTRITKEPVMEQVGVGTYSARPDSPDIVLEGSGEFSWPVNGGWISDVFISDRNHKGLDIAADMGTEIYAAGDGIALSAGWNSGGYGNVVMIDHLNGYQTVYGHMSKVAIDEGQYVTKGQLIGYVGSTGDSTGPHCHFEVRYQGVCYNPANYLNTTNLWNDLKENNTDYDYKRKRN